VKNRFQSLPFKCSLQRYFAEKMAKAEAEAEANAAQREKQLEEVNTALVGLPRRFTYHTPY
jgi:hypothetical protein